MTINVSTAPTSTAYRSSVGARASRWRCSDIGCGRSSSGPGNLRPMPWRPYALSPPTTGWFFLSHRLPLAHAIRTAGAEVVVVAGDSGKASAIRAEGFEFVAMPISRKGVNPVRELHTLRFLRRTYRRLQPDLVHHVTIKPV